MPGGCASTIMSSRSGAWLDRWHSLTRQSDHFPQDSGKSCFTFTSQPVLLHPQQAAYLSTCGLDWLTYGFLRLAWHISVYWLWVADTAISLVDGLDLGFSVHHSRRHGHFLPAICRRVSSLCPPYPQIFAF
jgi:hypothetical protein